jgi:hypothetical protein
MVRIVASGPWVHGGIAVHHGGTAELTYTHRQCHSEQTHYTAAFPGNVWDTRHTATVVID